MSTFDRHLGVWPEFAPERITLPDTSLYANLEITARRYPRMAAMIYYDTRITYGEFHAEAEALAGYLQRQGVGKGDRVMLYMQNSPQFVIGFYAILRADAVVVPVNPMNRTAELEYLVQDTGARIALCAQEVFPHLAPLLQSGLLEQAVVTAYADYVRTPTDLELPEAVREPNRVEVGGGVVQWAHAVDAGERPTPQTARPEDMAVLPYSSGTTGNPKGCVHTHRSTMATVVIGCAWSQATSDLVQLVSVPMFHVTGMQVCMNATVYIGGTMVIMTRWDRRVAAELIQRYRIAAWRNIPTMVVDLLADPEIDRYDLSSLRGIGGGGAAMPAAVEGRLFEKTGLRYMEGYGLTETMASTHINPSQAPKAQCLGIPIINVDSRVIDLDTLQELGPNETGEILINGPQVFEGYWNRPEETEAAFLELDGKRFFRSGDLGYYDEDGYFFLVDRVKRMINASGFKVWPTEVESLMYSHPAIQEVCVIASPDARRGETVKALVVLRPEQRDQVSEDDIISWCRENMAAYKCPRMVEMVDSLPKSPTGKLQWRLLQEEERERGSTAVSGG